MYKMGKADKINSKINLNSTTILILISIALLAGLLIGGCSSKKETSKNIKSVETSKVPISSIKDVADCNKLNDRDKANCYKELAYIKRDQSICDNIEVYGIKDQCYTIVAIAKQEASICKNTEDPHYNSECYKGIAIAKNDLRICDEISSEAYKDGCYREFSKAKGNQSVCENIKKQGVKCDCYSDIAMKKKDISICINAPRECQDFCYSLAAQDIPACENIKSQYAKEGCYEIIAIRNEDATICEKLEKQIERDFCIAKVGVRKEDFSVCDIVQNQTIKEGDCYFEIFEEYVTDKFNGKYTKQDITDITICYKIQDELVKSYCYMAVAVGRRDTSVCDQIEDQPLRDGSNGCYEAVNKIKLLNKS